MNHRLLGWQQLSLRWCYYEAIFRKAKHLAKALSQPLLLDNQIAITTNPNLVGESGKHRKERDLLIEAKVSQSPSKEWERGLAVDSLTMSLNPWSRIVQGKP
jgi:hypothetical protein